MSVMSSIFDNTVSFIKNAEKVADDVKPAAKAVGGLLDEAADFGFRAGRRGVEFVGGVANRAAAFEGMGAPAAERAMKTLTGTVQVTKVPTMQRVIFGGAAAAGVLAGVGKGVRRDVREAAQMTGVPTSFLSQSSIRRAYGYKDSRIRNDQSPQLGDLTLNLGNTSVLNRAIRK